MQKEVKHTDIVIIGAGLTGLTTGFWLKKAGKDLLILERSNRTGGQIHSFQEEGFLFESGPNTGVVSYPEIIELFEALSPKCSLETAREASKCRLIWKGDRFHALPAGLIQAVTTPLFTLKDKFRILGEPFRKKGTNPNESVAELAARRLGKSFVRYAVDPFLSGVYAGDPNKLITRYALPKLYNLEQQYGSFIRGSIAKAKQPKTDRDKLATKKVFSVKGGLNKLTDAMTEAIGTERILLETENISIQPVKGQWELTFHTPEGPQSLVAKHIVTTTGAYTLPQLLPFVPKEQMDKISNLFYAPVVQVSVGFNDTGKQHFQAFGGLVPSCEKKDVLGILYPSACFEGRSPQKGTLFSFFIGGVQRSELTSLSDEELKALIRRELHNMLKFPAGKEPDLIRIFRHQRAIPQYELSSGERFQTIEKIEKQYPGLILAGNIKGGIGMADRIHQASKVAERLIHGIQNA